MVLDGKFDPFDEDWDGEKDEEALRLADEKYGMPNTCDLYPLYEDAVVADDKDKFVQFFDGINQLPMGCKGYLYPSHFYPICFNSALNIARALLQGECGWKVNLNTPFNETYPIHVAASNFSNDFLELLIAHGARTDVRTKGPVVVDGLLPLNVAVEDTCLHSYLESWTKHDSVYKLIILLSLPEMKMFLDSISLLARHTDQTFDELLSYVEQGKLLQIAVLFMAAHKQIMATTHQDKDGNSRSAMDVIVRRMLDAMLYPNLRTRELPMKPKNGFSHKKHKVKVEALASARVIFQLIEKIGDSLCEFRQTLHSEVSHQEVIEYVASLFARVGVILRRNDTDLSNLNWYRYLDDRTKVEKSKGPSVYPPAPDHYQPPHVAASEELEIPTMKALRAQHKARFIPHWNSVLNWQALVITPRYADDKVIIGYDGINRDLEKLRKAGLRLQPLSKIKSAFKGTVPNYQRSRQYSTFASLILRVIKRI